MKLKNLIYLFIYLFIVLGLVLLGIFFSLNPSSKVKLLDVDKFEEMMNSENTFLINAHIPYQGELPNTDLFAEDWENMDTYLDELPEDKSTPILIYCRSGRMAQISGEQLIEMGYENVYNLDGGMKA